MEKTRLLLSYQFEERDARATYQFISESNVCSEDHTQGKGIENDKKMSFTFMEVHFEEVVLVLQ